ncbi:methionyl-tRNA formyltransferase [Ramlibacter albus]|uniref:Methionyl-tRNA formyltransferase n=1 Tax=Ramlibacter albus TaxID=2079448 RepID=A0A923S828_9BURK|nr:methionyl-tRNA formyltransferase [Ramlibacter albus]MBC5767692.1 methionyl-tRNA formyltransferase [Ramlibacter albus]
MTKIALLGQQDFGKAVLEAFLARGDEVVGVFCKPEAPGTKPDALRQAAQDKGVPVFQFASLRSSEADAKMRELAPDLGVMAYVTQFAPHSLVTIPRLGTIQYHPSLLPRHRGPSSISWPIVLGEPETGITIFRPTDGLDEGPVILQKRCAIEPDETLGELYFNKLFPLGVAALLEAADQVIAGTHEQHHQNESLATYEGWMHEEESRIHWHQHVDHIYNLIRGCNPAPGAWTEIAGEKVYLFDCHKHAVGTFGAVRGKPGEISAITPHAIFFNAHGGQIEVQRLRAASGKKMNAGEWAAAKGLVVSAS